MKSFLFIILFGSLALGGCYRVAPGEGEISTVPTTNNPNALPGSMKSSPMPSVF